MPNSLGTLNSALIAQQSLEYLSANYPIINSISTDFSNEAVLANAPVTSRIASVPALQDWDSVSGYVAQNAVATDVSVTLNKFKHSSVEFSDLENSSTNRSLSDDFSQAFADSIGLGVMAEIAALFTTGNITNSTIMAASGWNVQNVINAPNTALNKRNVPKSRFGIFNSDLYGALFNDQQVVNSQFGGNGVGSEKLPVLRGITMSDYSALPTTSNLVGVIGHKSSLLFAARVPSVGAPEGGKLTNVTDPKSGLTIQVREYYDWNKGKWRITFALIFGVAVADGTRAQLIRSA